MYGFNNARLTIPLPVSASTYPRGGRPRPPRISAIGQFNDQVTPLQEAMIAAAIANHGTLLTPYLVQQVKAPDLTTIQSARPSVLSRPVSPQVAAEMQTDDDPGDAEPGRHRVRHRRPAATLEIAGKTGTAQNGVNNPLDDAVFTCFAPVGVNNPRIAVGVIVKGGGFGADAAAPIAAADHPGVPGDAIERRTSPAADIRWGRADHITGRPTAAVRRAATR